MNMRTRLDELNRVLGRVAGGGRGRVVESRRGAIWAKVWRASERDVMKLMDVIYDDSLWDNRFLRQKTASDALSGLVSAVSDARNTTSLDDVVGVGFLRTNWKHDDINSVVDEVLDDHIVVVGKGYKYLDGGVGDYMSEILEVAEDLCISSSTPAVELFLGLDSSEKEFVRSWFVRNVANDPKTAATKTIAAMVDKVIDLAEGRFDRYVKDNGVEPIRASESCVVGLDKHIDDFWHAFEAELESRLREGVDELEVPDYLWPLEDVEDSEWVAEEDIFVDLKEMAGDIVESFGVGTDSVLIGWASIAPRSGEKDGIVDAARQAADDMAQSAIDGFQKMMDEANYYEAAEEYKRIYDDGHPELKTWIMKKRPTNSRLLQSFHYAERHWRKR